MYRAFFIICKSNNQSIIIIIVLSLVYLQIIVYICLQSAAKEIKKNKAATDFV